MVKRDPVFFLAVVCCTMLVACNKTHDVSGTYSGRVVLDESSKATVEGDILQSLAESATLKLELKKDGTFREEYLFFVLEGDYDVVKDSIILTPRSLNGVEKDEIADPNLKSQAVTKAFRISKDTLVRDSKDDGYSEIYTLESRG